MRTALCFLGAAWAAAAAAQTCTQIALHGVTFELAAPTPCGTFANGDPWVAPAAPGDPVTIAAIEPAFDGQRHGWEVNPSDPVEQGFDSRIQNFDAARVPSLPYAAAGGSSLVKGVSVAEGSCRPCLESAAILTVLDAPPADGGRSFFRPPYPGADKPLIDVGRLRFDLLPTLPSIPSAPTLAAVTASFAQPWLDHKNDWTGRALHPENSMPDYGADIARVSGSGVLRLMLEGDADERLEATIAAVQVGLDLYHAYLEGTIWRANGGHGPGRRILVTLAATLLDDPAMIRRLQAADPQTDFGEDGSVVFGAAAGITLWGLRRSSCGEQAYWNRLRFDTGPRSCDDPYGWIDGGEEPGGSYQFCCNSSVFRAAALALRLMPELRCAWPGERFLEYVDRWVAVGAHTQPDPCAPFDGDPDHYGVTYGPDGAGGCILDADPSDGIGRFPDRHGANANGGGHGSAFHGDLWTAYRDAAPEPVPCGVVFADDFESGGTGAWGTP